MSIRNCSLASVALFFSLSGPLMTATTTTISWQITISNNGGFDYSKMRAFVHYWGTTGRKVSSLGFFVMNGQGRFRTVVPVGSKVSVEILTSDPTVRWKTDSSPGLDFYLIEKARGDAMLGIEQVDVPADSPPNLSYFIDLSRAAALVLCNSVEFVKGSVQFRNLSRPAEDAHLLLFRDPGRVRGAILGGLAPGTWQVSYLNEQGEVQLSELLELREGDVHRMTCN